MSQKHKVLTVTLTLKGSADEIAHLKVLKSLDSVIDAVPVKTAGQVLDFVNDQP